MRGFDIGAENLVPLASTLANAECRLPAAVERVAVSLLEAVRLSAKTQFSTRME
jgi:hypothetical protein